MGNLQAIPKGARREDQARPPKIQFETTQHKTAQPENTVYVVHMQKAWYTKRREITLVEISSWNRVPCASRWHRDSCNGAVQVIHVLPVLLRVCLGTAVAGRPVDVVRTHIFACIRGLEVYPATSVDAGRPLRALQKDLFGAEGRSGVTRHVVEPR